MLGRKPGVRSVKIDLPLLQKLEKLCHERQNFLDVCKWIRSVEDRLLLRREWLVLLTVSILNYQTFSFQNNLVLRCIGKNLINCLIILKENKCEAAFAIGFDLAELDSTKTSEKLREWFLGLIYAEVLHIQLALVLVEFRLWKYVVRLCIHPKAPS